MGRGMGKAKGTSCGQSTKRTSRRAQAAPRLWAAVVSALAVTGCAGGHSNPLDRANLDAQGQRAEVALIDVTEEEWTSALIVCPYRPENIVEQRLGIDHPLDTMRDSVTHLVFASETKVEDVVPIRTYDDANLCTMDAPVLTPQSRLELERADTWELSAIR